MWPFTPKKTNPKIDALRAEYEALVPRMVEDHSENIDGVDAQICVRPLLSNDRGRLALRVARNSYGNWAIHEINKDGTFSQKGPYWLKVPQYTWRYNGQYAEVAILVAPEGMFFKIKNPFQDGGVHRMGYRVLEFNTAKLPTFEWKDFMGSRGPMG